MRRSPYACFHLLREAEVTQAVETYPDTHKIWQRNQITVQEIGADGMQQLLDRCRKERSSAA